MSNQLQDNLNLILEEKNTKLLPENLKSGVTVLGITGTLEQSGGIDTSDATAVAEDIISGKTAYVNGEKINGAIVEITEGNNAGFQYNNLVNIGPDNGLYVTAIHPDDTSFAIRKNAEVSTYIPYANVANVIGLTSDKLAIGNTILGIDGTANVEDGVGLVYDLSTLPSGPEGSVRIHVNHELTEFYGIYKCVGLDSWEGVQLSNVLAGEDYNNALTITEDILDGPDEEPGNDVELPADYDGHLDTLTAALCANELGGSPIPVDTMSVSAPKLPNNDENVAYACDELNNVLPNVEYDGLTVKMYGRTGGSMTLSISENNRYAGIQNASGDEILLYTITDSADYPTNDFFIEWPGDEHPVCVTLTEDDRIDTDFEDKYNDIGSIQVFGNEKYFTQNNLIIALLTLEKIYNCTITYGDIRLDNLATYLHNYPASADNTDVVPLEYNILMRDITVHDNNNDISLVLEDLVSDIQYGESFVLEFIQSDATVENASIRLQIDDMQRGINITDPVADANGNPRIYYNITHPSAMNTNEWVRFGYMGPEDLGDAIHDRDFNSLFTRFDNIVIYISDRLKTTENIKAALQAIETIFGTTIELMD